MPQPLKKKKTKTAPPKKKSRSPVELGLVWGGIGLLVLVVGWEASNRFGYNRSLKELQAAIAQEDTPDGKPVSLTDAEAMIHGFPRKTEETGELLSLVTYRWKGLLKDHGAIHLLYDTPDRLVTGMFTDRPPLDDLRRDAAQERPAKNTGESSVQ